MVKSCFSDGFVVLSIHPSIRPSSFWGVDGDGGGDGDGEGCLGDAIADGRGARRSGASVLLRVIVHSPSTGCGSVGVSSLGVGL